MVSEEKLMPPKSLTALLAGVVDYAGLFPPAGLSMRDAVQNFAEYKKSSDAWMLARFIVPVARLEEFANEAEPFLPRDSSPWRLSALCGTEFQADVSVISDFIAKRNGAIIDTVEIKAGRVEEILVDSS
jgi:hypothetical protein